MGPHVKPGLKFIRIQKSKTDKAKIIFELILSKNLLGSRLVVGKGSWKKREVGNFFIVKSGVKKFPFKGSSDPEISFPEINVGSDKRIGKGRIR